MCTLCVYAILIFGQNCVNPDADTKVNLCVFLICSCMKTLGYPLLEVQLKDPDTLPVSPLRNFATEILV